MPRKTAKKSVDIVIQVAQPVVSQRDLLAIETQRASIASQEDALKKARAALASDEKEVLTKLQAGAKVEMGLYTASFHFDMGRSAPSYQDLLVMHMECVHNIPRETTVALAQGAYPAKQKKDPTLDIGRTPGVLI